MRGLEHIVWKVISKYHGETESGALGSGETVSVRENLRSKSQDSMNYNRTQVTATRICMGQ